jgi:hypothetical protein
MELRAPAAAVRPGGLTFGGTPATEEELVLRFHDRAFLIALSRTHDREAALDLAQETLLAVIRSLRDGHLHDPEKLHIFVSARNGSGLENHWISCFMVVKLEPELPPSDESDD